MKPGHDRGLWLSLMQPKAIALMSLTAGTLALLMTRSVAHVEPVAAASRSAGVWAGGQAQATVPTAPPFKIVGYTYSFRDTKQADGNVRVMISMMGDYTMTPLDGSRLKGKANLSFWEYVRLGPPCGLIFDSGLLKWTADLDGQYLLPRNGDLRSMTVSATPTPLQGPEYKTWSVCGATPPVPTRPTWPGIAGDLVDGRSFVTIDVPTGSHVGESYTSSSMAVCPPICSLPPLVPPIQPGTGRVITDPPPPPPPPPVRPSQPRQSAGASDLTLTYEPSVNPVIGRSRADYRFVVTNSGLATATNTLFTSVVPQGLMLVSARSSVGPCEGRETLLCNLGALAAKASATVFVSVTAPSAGTWTQKAAVISPTLDSNFANNATEARVQIIR